MRTVSPMTANQEFFKLVREVERGEGFLIAPARPAHCEACAPQRRQRRRPRVGGTPTAGRNRE